MASGNKMKWTASTYSPCHFSKGLSACLPGRQSIPKGNSSLKGNYLLLWRSGGYLKMEDLLPSHHKNHQNK